MQDTFRAQWAWTILFVPDRVPGMVRSMLADYQQVGLPLPDSYVFHLILPLSERLAANVEEHCRNEYHGTLSSDLTYLLLFLTFRRSVPMQTRLSQKLS